MVCQGIIRCIYDNSILYDWFHLLGEDISFQDVINISNDKQNIGLGRGWFLDLFCDGATDGNDLLNGDVSLNNLSIPFTSHDGMKHQIRPSSPPDKPHNESVTLYSVTR